METEIVEEGGKFYEKVEIDVSSKIAEQEAIVNSLQQQIERAKATISELKAL